MSDLCFVGTPWAKSPFLPIGDTMSGLTLSAVKVGNIALVTVPTGMGLLAHFAGTVQEVRDTEIVLVEGIKWRSRRSGEEFAKSELFDLALVPCVPANVKVMA